VNVDGVNVPLVQRRVVSDGVYPILHAAVQSKPDVMRDP